MTAEAETHRAGIACLAWTASGLAREMRLMQYPTTGAALGLMGLGQFAINLQQQRKKVWVVQQVMAHWARLEFEETRDSPKR